MKQTAVEWLVEQIKNNVHNTVEEFELIVNQAKAMEKEQIKNAWINSLTTADYHSSEQYYNKTFKSE
jgi:hypothetical protein